MPKKLYKTQIEETFAQGEKIQYILSYTETSNAMRVELDVPDVPIEVMIDTSDDDEDYRPSIPSPVTVSQTGDVWIGSDSISNNVKVTITNNTGSVIDLSGKINTNSVFGNPTAREFASRSPSDNNRPEAFVNGKGVYTFDTASGNSLNTDDQSLGSDSSFGHPRVPLKSPQTFEAPTQLNGALLTGLENASSAQGTGSVEDDTTNFRQGTQGVKVSDSSFARADVSLSSSADLSDDHLQFWAYLPDVSVINRLQIFAKTNGFTDYFEAQIESNTLLDGWNLIALSRAHFFQSDKITGSPDWANINSLSFGVSFSSQGSVTFDDVQAVPSSSGKVTLRLDDGSIDSWDYAKPKLDEYNFKATIATPTGSVGDSGKLDLSQLKTFYEQGYDIISHQVNEQDLTSLSLDEVEDELYRSQKWLLDNGFNRSARFFVPHNHQMNEEVASIASKYFLNPLYNNSSGTHKINAVNFTGLRSHIDATLIDDYSLSELQTRVDNTEEGDGHLLLYWHPSSSNTKWEDILDYIASANVDVETFSDLY